MNDWTGEAETPVVEIERRPETTATKVRESFTNVIGIRGSSVELTKCERGRDWGTQE